MLLVFLSQTGRVLVEAALGYRITVVRSEALDTGQGDLAGNCGLGRRAKH